MKKIWIPVTAIILFLILACLVFSQNSIILGFDKIIETFFASIHNSFFERFFTEITRIGDVIPASIFILALAFVLFISKKHTKAKILLISSGIAITLGTFIKEIAGRVRPPTATIDTIGSSFPSNHAIIATVLCLFFIYELSEYVKIRWQKVLVSVLVILLFVLLALSRLVLNVHWTSDVIAGILIGIMCFSISKVIEEK